MLLDLLSVVAPLIETILKIDIFQVWLTVFALHWLLTRWPQPFTAIATTLQTKLAAKQQATNDDVDISVLECAFEKQPTVDLKPELVPLLVTSMSLSSTQRQQLSAWKDASSALCVI